PADAIGRSIGVQTRFLLAVQLGVAAGQGFVAGLGRGGRIFVTKRREVVRPLARPDDVVLLRTIELEQPELRLREPQAIAALGVASEFGMVGMGRLFLL